MPSFPPEEEVAIQAACREHEAMHSRGNKETACVLIEPYIVKYSDPKTLASHIKMQSFLSNANQQSDKPCVPELIHHFNNG